MSTKQRKGDKAAVSAKGKETPVETDAEKSRYTKLIVELSDKLPDKLAPHVRTAAPYLATAIVYVSIATPYVVQGAKQLHAIAIQLPEKIVYATLGFLLCFFGGVFPATIAAAEAWQLCGGKEGVRSCTELYQEFMKVLEANKADDVKDEDKDGVADTNQLASSALLSRKMRLVMRSVDPNKVSSALVALYTGWIGVLAILKIQFAKTVTLGEVIGEQVYKPVSKFEPVLSELVPEDCKHWVPVVVRLSCKGVAITFAWWIQRVISAFHSAMRGGHMFGKYVVGYLHEKNILKADSESTYLDEAIGWGIAALGLLFQISVGFHLPFFFALFLWPIKLVEAFVIWSMMA